MSLFASLPHTAEALAKPGAVNPTYPGVPSRCSPKGAAQHSEEAGNVLHVAIIMEILCYSSLLRGQKKISTVYLYSQLRL
jgi:hypothetical protein